MKSTKDEIRAFMVSHTTDSFRRLFHMIGEDFLDSAALLLKAWVWLRKAQLVLILDQLLAKPMELTQD